MNRLKKSITAVGLAVTMFASFSLSVWAHDGWTQTNAPIIAPGEVSYVDILLGNHSNEHRSYRIDGQFSVNSKVFVTTPTGVKTDITATRFYTGEVAPATTNVVNNGYIASFSPEAPGAYVVTAESDATRTSSGVTTRTLRNAKSFVAVGDLPLLDRVKSLKGFSAVINKDRAELIPKFNPAAVTANNEVSVQLLLKGAPLADAEVSVVRRSVNTEPQTVKTDANGVAAFKLGPADYYLFRAKPTTKENEPGKYSGVNYEATMSIVVQNGKVIRSVKSDQPIPLVFVGASTVTPTKIEIRKGVTFVDGAFLKQHVSKSYRGRDMVPLRETAERLGAMVEVLPAVDGYRAAIVIHAKP